MMRREVTAIVLWALSVPALADQTLCTGAINGMNPFNGNEGVYPTSVGAFANNGNY